MLNNLNKFLSVLFISSALVACGGENGGASQGDTSANGSGTSATAVEQEVYEWKMITSWPKNLPALGTSPEYFADIVETMSNGRMKIRVYGANELVGGLEVFDAVSQGVAEIGHTGAYYWQGKKLMSITISLG